MTHQSNSQRVWDSAVKLLSYRPFSSKQQQQHKLQKQEREIQQRNLALVERNNRLQQAQNNLEEQYKQQQQNKQQQQQQTNQESQQQQQQPQQQHQLQKSAEVENLERNQQQSISLEHLKKEHLPPLQQQQQPESDKNKNDQLRQPKQQEYLRVQQPEQLSYQQQKSQQPESPPPQEQQKGDRGLQDGEEYKQQLVIQQIIVDQLLKQHQQQQQQQDQRRGSSSSRQGWEPDVIEMREPNNNGLAPKSFPSEAELYSQMGEFVSVSGGGVTGESALTDPKYETASELLLRRTKSIGAINGRKAAASERVRSCKSLRDLTAFKEEPSGKMRWTQRMSSMLMKDMGQQSFTEQQRKTLSAFSSLSYTPTHSIAYVDWISEQKSRLYHRLEWDRWFLVFLIGVSIGCVASLLKQSIQALSNLQWRITKSYLKEDELASGFFFQAGLNCSYVLVGSFLVTFIHPPAVGGGTPEVLAYLNGIIVHGTLSLKNLIVKFCGNVLAVAGGLPAATQAPIITYGAIIGSGVGQFQSKQLGISPATFTRFRNPEDRRQFTTNGVAAGVSAGFNAPIGGLLFAMEDLSSFWSKGLSWQTFFCCVVATAVAQMFNTAFSGFDFKGSFGGFNVNLVEPIQMHVATLLPAALLGVMGGLLGAFFTRVNTLLGKHRKMFYAKIKGPHLQRSLKILEPILIALFMTVYTVFLPLGFSCQSMKTYYQYSTYSTCNFTGKMTMLPRSFGLSSYNCPSVDNQTQDLYNPMATLIQGSGTGYLDKLWSRGTYMMFDWYICLSAFIIFFLATIYTAGTAIAGGIFVPVLICGSLLGRALGVAMIYIWQAVEVNSYPVPPWMWVDPGVMAAMGAAALLAGVNRLAVASTVIVVEMVGDLYLIIPILVAIFVSKMIADLLSKPLYKYMLDSKALPFLEQNPIVYVKGKRLNLEMSRASDVMSSPVETIHIKEMIAFLAYLLLNTTHSAFPVVKYDDETKTELAYGLITRIELYIILCSNDVYEREDPGVVKPNISAEELSVDYIADPKAAEERIRTYIKFDKVYSQIFVDLDRYINMSMPKIDQDYSLYRTYLLFRTLGLRNLVIIDVHNRVVGMITRKDLMQFNIEEKLHKIIDEQGNENEDDDDGERDEEKVIMTMGKHEDHSPSQASIETMRPQGLYVRQGSKPSTHRKPSTTSLTESPDGYITLPAITVTLPTVSSQVPTIHEEEGKDGRAGSRTPVGEPGSVRQYSGTGVRPATGARQRLTSQQRLVDMDSPSPPSTASTSCNITLI